MTHLRPTSSPIKLPRASRAALLGFTLFSAIAGTTALADGADAQRAPVAVNAPQQTAVTQAAQPATPPANTAQAAVTTEQTSARAQHTAAQTDRADAVSTVLPSGKELSLGLSRWDYKNADFFKRISEYFSGVENTGYRIILRTDPQQREGLYFQAPLSVAVRDLPQGAAFEVRFVRPDKADQTVTHTFAIPADLHNSDKTQLWLGFTGADTPADEAAPVAWQIRVIDAEGKQLAETHSFLWSPRDGR